MMDHEFVGVGAAGCCGFGCATGCRGNLIEPGLRAATGTTHIRSGTAGVPTAGLPPWELGAAAVLGLSSTVAGTTTLWNGTCAIVGARTKVCACGYGAAFAKAGCRAAMACMGLLRTGERLLLRNKPPPSKSPAEPEVEFCMRRLAADAVVTTELPPQPRMVLAVSTALVSSACKSAGGGVHCGSPFWCTGGVSRVDLGVVGIPVISFTGSSRGRSTLTSTIGDSIRLEKAISEGAVTGVTGDDIILLGE